MYCYMARQPILDASKNLYGYELLFRDGVANCFPNINADEATSKLITEHHLLMGVEKITGSKKAFINFSADTSAKRGRATKSPNLRVKMSGKEAINFWSKSRSTPWRPKPRMSKAVFETK